MIIPAQTLNNIQYVLQHTQCSPIDAHYMLNGGGGGEVLNPGGDKVLGIIAFPIIGRSGQQSTESTSWAQGKTQQIAELDVPCETITHFVKGKVLTQAIQRFLFKTKV